MDEILNTKEWISIPSQYQIIPEEEYLDPKNTKKNCLPGWHGPV